MAQFANNCYSWRTRAWCIGLNSGTFGPDDVEARALVAGGLGAYEWRTDYVKLWRKTNLNNNATLVRWTSPTGWMSGGNDTFSTGNFNFYNNPGYFYSTVRLRFRLVGCCIQAWQYAKSRTAYLDAP